MGTPGEDRTPDTTVRSRVLCPLSYRGGYLIITGHDKDNLCNGLFCCDNLFDGSLITIHVFPGHLLQMVPAAGLEPASACAMGLKSIVSANSTMRAVLLQSWCNGLESNQRRPGLQPGALPTELPLRGTPHRICTCTAKRLRILSPACLLIPPAGQCTTNLVRPVGLEPTTLALKGRYSIQLSYKRVKNGWEAGHRTPVTWVRARRPTARRLPKIGAPNGI